MFFFFRGDVEEGGKRRSLFSRKNVARDEGSEKREGTARCKKCGFILLVLRRLFFLFGADRWELD